MSEHTLEDTYVAVYDDPDRDEIIVDVIFQFSASRAATRDDPAEEAEVEITSVIEKATGKEIETSDKQNEDIESRIWDFVFEGGCDKPEPDDDDHDMEEDR
jgi:hypothetical protein